MIRNILLLILFLLFCSSCDNGFQTVEEAIPTSATPSGPTGPTTPAKVKVFFASGHQARTIMSCDDGQTWINDRSDNDSARCWVATTDPNYVECDHSTIANTGLDYGDGYFFVQFGWGYPGTIRRTQDGVNWETVKSGSTGGGLAFINTLLFTNFGGWSVSNNHGDTFSALAGVSTDYSYPWIYRVGTKMIILGRAAGAKIVGVSTDNGATWINPSGSFLADWASNGFAEGNGILLSTGNTYDNMISMGVGHSAVSTDNGATWTNYQAFSGLYRRWGSRVIFNGTHFINWSNGRTYKSTDGITWTDTQAYIDGSPIGTNWDIVSTFNPDTGTYVGFLNLWGSNYTSQKAYRSTDGVNWTTLTSGQFAGGHPIRYVTVGEVDATACP